MLEHYKGAAYAVIALLLICCLLPLNQVHALNNKKVGMWYSTWYSTEGNYNWLQGYGVGDTANFLADVNHDGKADALMYWNVNSPGFRGIWYVALAKSTGDGFNAPTIWRSSQPQMDGYTNLFVADVNNDKNADIIYYDGTNGNCIWYVGLSNGANGFAALQQWTAGQGCGSTDRFVADVNGDHSADIVLYFDNNQPGTDFYAAWYAGLSNGVNGFGGATKMITSFGHGSGKRMMADVTGDDRADAVTYTDIGAVQGDWYAAQSNYGVNGDTHFINPHEWVNYHGHGSKYQLLGDVNGDNKADAVVYFETFGSEGGYWYRAESNGTTFDSSQTGSIWKKNHGNWLKSKIAPATFVGLANVDGDVTASGYGTADPVTYQPYNRDGSGIGMWRAMTKGATYQDPAEYNTWQAYDIAYKQYVNGTATQYDSNNTSVIDSHLAQIDAAGIDYILLDLTNGVYDLQNNQGANKWITARAKTVCQEVAAYDALGHNLQFAVATGLSQWANPWNSVGIVESEADMVQRNFVNDPTCGPHYFQWQGKPLIANYFIDTAQKNYWQNQYPHTYTNNFTMKYVLGDLPNLKDSGLPANYPSSTGSGCGTPFPSGPSVFPQAGEYGNYVGWGLPYGTADPGTGRVIEVQPGWNNHSTGTPRKIARTQNGTEMGFYTTCAWNRALSAPYKDGSDMLVINSYNEFAEETAIAPSDTNQVVNDLPGARWQLPDEYWNQTVSNIASYKN